MAAVAAALGADRNARVWSDEAGKDGSGSVGESSSGRAFADVVERGRGGREGCEEGVCGVGLCGEGVGGGKGGGEAKVAGEGERGEGGAE